MSLGHWGGLHNRRNFTNNRNHVHEVSRALRVGLKKHKKYLVRQPAGHKWTNYFASDIKGVFPDVSALPNYESLKNVYESFGGKNANYYSDANIDQFKEYLQKFSNKIVRHNKYAFSDEENYRMNKEINDKISTGFKKLNTATKQVGYGVNRLTADVGRQSTEQVSKLTDIATLLPQLNPAGGMPSGSGSGSIITPSLPTTPTKSSKVKAPLTPVKATIKAKKQGEKDIVIDIQTSSPSIAKKFEKYGQTGKYPESLRVYYENKKVQGDKLIKSVYGSKYKEKVDEMNKYLKAVKSGKSSPEDIGEAAEKLDRIVDYIARSRQIPKREARRLSIEGGRAMKP